MARKRNTATSTNNTNTGEHKMAGLSAEQIAQLLGKTRTKGQYVVYLNQFLESGEGGLCVNEQWVDLRDKKAATLKQGFEGAKDNKEAQDGSENVKVIANEDKVYLINLAAAGIEVPEEAAA
jgi:hypothetical protein